MNDMNKSFFNDEQLAELKMIAKLAAGASDFHEFVKKTLRFLRSCGFQSARYYECATSRPENDELLILASQESLCCHAEIGYAIRYRTSTLGQAPDSLVPAIGSSKDTNEHWVRDLQLSNGSTWVDIPVRSSNRLIGLLAVDWHGTSEKLTPGDIGVLAAVGCLLANVSESVSAMDADRVESAFSNSIHENAEGIEAALNIAINELVSTLNFGIVSVFQRSRGGTKLKKVFERLHPKISVDVPDFPEEYLVGHYLTGLAWEKDESRHIVDFSAQLDRRKHEVENKSLDRHTALLGEIKSVLYSKIESREPRFMIRIMNCVDSPLPVIVAAQRKIVDRITKSIAAHIDDVVAKERLDQVIDIARVASRNVTRPHEVVEHVRKAIRDEGFDDLIVISRHKDQTIGTLFVDLPRDLNDSQIEQIDWSESTFIQVMTTPRRPLMTHKVAALATTSDTSLFKLLKNHGYEVLITKPFESSSVKGFIAILCRESFKDTRSNRENVSLGEIIDTFATIICSSIDGYDLHVTAEGSRKFMGRIGHEVRSPALDSAQSAILGLALAQRAIQFVSSDNARELREILNEALMTVNEKAKEIDRMMEFAKLAALQEVGNVQFNFQNIDVGNLLKEVVDSLKQQKELVSIDSGGRIRECSVVFNKGVLTLGNIVGDPTYLKVVFSHLLRNAAKYSLPRIPGKPLEINIIARPEPQMAIVQIVNWGVGIDPSEFETIFRPHIRGTAHDRRKAIGGLGLGLYISRLLINAHKGGTVFCLRSVPTLNDAYRIANFEGFETAFEVRLSRNGTVGVKTIDLGN